jgi:3-polyprenyl-4-hydroxybenzoate decarboxylase
MLKNCDFEKHATFSEGALDVLDHSAPQPIYGSKIGFDCTTKLKEENFISKNDLLNLIEEQFKHHTWDKFIIFDIEQNKIVEPIFSI